MFKFAIIQVLQTSKSAALQSKCFGERKVRTLIFIHRLNLWI